MHQIAERFRDITQIKSGLLECVTPEHLDQIFTLFSQTTVNGRRLVIFDEIQNVRGLLWFKRQRQGD